jgi:hypothetical protein
VYVCVCACVCRYCKTNNITIIRSILKQYTNLGSLINGVEFINYYNLLVVQMSLRKINDYCFGGVGINQMMLLFI